jgi:hypothetical protein
MFLQRFQESRCQGSLIEQERLWGGVDDRCDNILQLKQGPFSFQVYFDQMLDIIVIVIVIILIILSLFLEVIIGWAISGHSRLPLIPIGLVAGHRKSLEFLLLSGSGCSLISSCFMLNMSALTAVWFA